MMRALAIVRVCVYAAFAVGAAFSPNIPRTLALLSATRPAASPPALADAASLSLGWLTRAIVDALGSTLGYTGLAFATALTILVTFALVEWRARRVSSPATALLAVVLCGTCSIDALHVAGGASNGLFLAALLVAFELPGTAGLGVTAVLSALWCNASPAGILAPLFALAYALGAMIDRADRTERIRTQTRTLVAALATLATPAFIAYPVDAWHAITLDTGVADLLNTSPSVAAPLAYFAGVVLTILAALAIGARSAQTGSTLAFIVAAVLAFSQGGFVPLVGIAGAPILAESAGRLFNRARAIPLETGSFARAIVLTVLPVAFVVGLIAIGTLPSFAEAASLAPFGALARYASEPAQRGRLLCTHLEWCDVAERRYGIDVAADTRIANAPDTEIAAQRTISGAKQGWVAKTHARHVDAILVDARSGFATLLVADGWRKVATDGIGALFVRGGATP